MANRSNSPFTTEQPAWMIVQYGEVKSSPNWAIKLGRKFRIQYKLAPKKVPQLNAFMRLIDRFLSSGSVHPSKPKGCTVSKCTPDKCAIIKTMVEENPSISIRKISGEMEMAIGTRQQYWFQQDGATAHTTIQVRNWLASKFSNRIISRLTERPWPARSLNLSPLDYWFWSVCLGELRRSPPSSLDELQKIVENFVENLQEEEVIKATRNILKRAKVCKEAGGGTFEFRLKKKQNMFAAEE